MAHSAIWYYTAMPSSLVDVICEEVKQFETVYETSQIGDGEKISDLGRRDSSNSWIPSSHWMTGLLWYYVQKANKNNFMYDLTEIDGEALQLTKYGNGQHYSWHQDSYLSNYLDGTTEQHSGVSQARAAKKNEIDSELVRKLSFSLQLSDPGEYKGGQLQFLLDNNTFFAPKQKGTLIVFDSRLTHRVRPISEGVRKSIVGWVNGPRWK